MENNIGPLGLHSKKKKNLLVSLKRQYMGKDRSFYELVGCNFREGNGNALQYSCLENPMIGGAWYAAIHGVTESGMTEQLHFHFSLSCSGEGNGNPFQCSCLENPRDRDGGGGAWWVAISGVA